MPTTSLSLVSTNSSYQPVKTRTHTHTHSPILLHQPVNPFSRPLMSAKSPIQFNTAHSLSCPLTQSQQFVCLCFTTHPFPMPNCYSTQTLHSPFVSTLTFIKMTHFIADAFERKQLTII